MTIRRRIAIICDYDLDYLGGAQTALLQQAAALTAAGCEVIILSPSKPATWQRMGVPGVDHIVIPARWTLPVLRLPVVPNRSRIRDRLRSILIDRQIGVIHLHSEFGVAAAAVQVAGQLHLPVIHTVHTFFWQAPLPDWFPLQLPMAMLIRHFHQTLTQITAPQDRLSTRPIDSALRNMTHAVASRATRVVSPSAHQARALAAAGLDTIDVIANTVVAADQSAEPVASVDGPVKIIWIGRCVPEKRILPFVHAVVRAIDRIGGGRLQAQIVGEGPQLHRARRVASGYRDISFLGRCRHDRVTELLAGSHALALTSQGFDNQPMTIVEAVTALRGVIYCDARLSEGLSGPGIWTAGTPEALSKTLIHLVRDPQRLIEASSAALRARDEFCPEHQVRQLTRTYRQAATEIGCQPTPESD